MVSRLSDKKAQRLSPAETAYRIQQSKCQNRNIDFLLSFEQWYNWWLSHGIDKNTYKSNSRDGNAPCMCRFNDTGAYELSNIYLATRSQNSHDARTWNPTTGNHRDRAIKTPLGIFKNATLAGLAHKCTSATIRNRLKTGKYPKSGYEYFDANYSMTQKIQTPFGQFDSLPEAAKAIGVHKSTIIRRCQQLPKEYYYV